MIRYQAAIIRDDQILLLKVNDRASGLTFWVIPGGGREAGESEEECVQREVREETHLHVVVGGMLLDEPAGDGMYERNKTYICQIMGGEARPGSEPEVDTADHTTIREVGWFDLRDTTTWGDLAPNDSLIRRRLQRLRYALGYRAEDTASRS